MNTTKLSNKLKKLRLKKGITQDEASKALYVSRQAISRWEIGKSIPDYETLLNICKFYNTTLNDLFDVNSKEDLVRVVYNNFKSYNFYKKVFRIVIFLFVIFFIIFSLLFTIKYYNKNSIYEIEYKSSEISCNQGLLVTSPEYIYFSPCKINFLSSEKLKTIKFYYLYQNKERLIFEGGENSMNFVWRDTRKDSELFDLKHLKIDKEIPKIYVHVVTESGNEYTLELTSNKWSANNI